MVTGTTNGFTFQTINSLIESCGVRLTSFDCKTHANKVDELFSTFYRNFNEIINKHTPIKTLSQRRIKQFSKPWIAKGIRTSIKEKNRLYQIGDHEKYKYYRNKNCNLTRLSKKHYYNGTHSLR